MYYEFKITLNVIFALKCFPYINDVYLPPQLHLILYFLLVYSSILI